VSLKRLFMLLLLAVAASAAAQPVEMQTGIRLAQTPLTIAEARQLDDFSPPPAAYVNYGFTSKTAWVRLQIANRGGVPTERMLDLENPLLESAELYGGSGKLLQRKGMLHDHKYNLHPAFELLLPPQTERTYWLRIRNTTTALQFGLNLVSPEAFERADRRAHSLIVVFLGMLAAIWILSLLMYAYTRDSSFALYAFYLATLVFQQLTYLGFLPLHMPLWFTRIDNAAVVPKVGIMIIAAALYARAFLKTRQLPGVDRGYRLFIYVVLAEIPLTGTPWFYLPEAVVLTGFFYILYNTAAGVFVYRRGHKEARFFIAAWLMLVTGYLVMIADALGFASIMHLFPPVILGVTVIEALLLMLAFVDRFKLVDQQKLEYERRYGQLLSEQNRLITEQVRQRTEELARAMHEKETLFKELHHRVKNNLQLILSIIRLQSNRAAERETVSELQTLQQRIATIAETHEILYQDGGSETVDMEHYLKALSHGIIRGLSEQHIRFECHCRIVLPTRTASYIGLILNELVTNALKHSDISGTSSLSISMRAEAETIMLEIVVPHDKHAEPAAGGLGMTIVRTLVNDQLGGTIEQSLNDSDHTIIRFPSC